MENNKFQKIIEFENAALSLDRMIQIENREMITKGFVNSSIRKNLRIFVRSGDHDPAHFHVKSDQRNYHQKFIVEQIVNISTNIDSRFDAYIQKFFIKEQDVLRKIKQEFYRLNPHLYTPHYEIGLKMVH